MRFKRYNISLIILPIMMIMLLISCSSENMLENDGEFLDYLDIDRGYSHIDYLANEMGVRVSSSKEENTAAKYIEEQFKSMGYKVNISKFKNNSAKSINIEAIKVPSGKDEDDTDEIVYVTSHYDSFDESPGANDNASGVAAMLEIANVIKDLDIDREVRFVAFGSEEFGLRGSGNYVYKLKEDEIARSTACFNLDMIATSYKGFDELRAYTVKGDKNIVTEALYEARKKFDSEEYYAKKSLYNDTSNGKIDSINASDHYSFSQVGIPAALFINVNPVTNEVAEPYIHTNKDTLDNVDLERFERSLNLIGKAVYDTINVNN